MSIRFYNENADQFFKDTFEADLSPIYQRFLPLIPPGGSILDAGCGSGRDTKAFSERGFKVDAFDASFAMVSRARALTQQTIYEASFESFKAGKSYDGIWASASLLHVPRDELPRTFIKLIDMLKETGLLYASFRYGSTDRHRTDRSFTDMNEHQIQSLVLELPRALTIETWNTPDRRPDRDDQWLNAIIRPDPNN